MFEPLVKLLGQHGDKLETQLKSIRGNLAAVASNTEAMLTRSQFTRKSIGVAKKTTGQLRNDSAYGWLIKWVATSTKAVRIYIGNENEESFFCELTTTAPQERVEWYLPVGGVIFVKNGSEEETFVNFETEVLVAEAEQGSTGPSGEQIGVARREPVPSGTPLDTPEAP